jgi:4-hydroxybenzoate polyprenyltransferase
MSAPGDVATVRCSDSELVARVSERESITLLWREARPGVQMIFVLRFLAGVVLAGGGAALLSWRVALGLLGWSAVVVAIYVRNGVADVVEDRFNGSTRPIAAGRLPVDLAQRASWWLVGGGVVVSAVLDPRAGVLAGAMAAAGWAYSSGPRPMKESVAGFAAVVFTGGLLTYLDAGLLAHGSLSPATCCFALAMSLWMTTAGSSKDLSDADGDRLAGRRTLPVLLGDARAARVVAVATLTLAAAFVAAAWRIAPPVRLSAAILAAGAVVTAVTLLRTTADADRGRRRRPYHAFMITQYAVHLAVFPLAAIGVV